jgi:hypothetical protein
VSATAERRKPKRWRPDPDDEPIRNREVSSLSMLVQRYREIHAAVRASDEQALRAELRKLSTEAALLAEQDAIMPSAVAVRMRIAATARPTGPR